jgi:predicted amidohydrolase YtcJ
MPGSFAGESPTRAILDSAIRDRPAAILSFDAHDLWFNTAAMRACRIDEGTPDPGPWLAVLSCVMPADCRPVTRWKARP